MTCSLMARCKCARSGEISAQCESIAEMYAEERAMEAADDRAADMAAADDIYGREGRHYGEIR